MIPATNQNRRSAKHFSSLSNKALNYYHVKTATANTGFNKCNASCNKLGYTADWLWLQNPDRKRTFNGINWILNVSHGKHSEM